MGASTPLQVEELIEKGFHKAAGLCAEDFESCAGRPSRPGGLLVISERLITIPQQCALLGVTNKLEVRQLMSHENTVPLPNKYLYWCHGIDPGRGMKGFPPEEAIQKLRDSKRSPANTAVVLAIFRLDLHQLSFTHRIDIGGSRVEKDYAPVLLLANGHPISDTPHLSSAKMNSKGSIAWGMASFESAE